MLLFDLFQLERAYEVVLHNSEETNQEIQAMWAQYINFLVSVSQSYIYISKISIRNSEGQEMQLNHQQRILLFCYLLLSHLKLSGVILARL